MNFSEMPGITPAKIEELKNRIRTLAIDLSEIEEQFAKGSGKGGQKINKTSNCVILKYPKLNLLVRCQRERKRSINRFLALRELVDKIEIIVSPQTSKKLREIDKIRKKKSRKRNKQKKKAK
jgi:peptide chain release factor